MESYKKGDIQKNRHYKPIYASNFTRDIRNGAAKEAASAVFIVVSWARDSLLTANDTAKQIVDRIVSEAAARIYS
ncbi:hypothetical protein ASG85_15440 [Paenibacillus sp. Soil724D2]|nr:hypothetical protein ASG85_15440 [Paenibacillus sp. Soil724D2]